MPTLNTSFRVAIYNNECSEKNCRKKSDSSSEAVNIIVPSGNKELTNDIASPQLSNELSESNKKRCTTIIEKLKKRCPAPEFDKGAAKYIFRSGYFADDVVQDIAKCGGSSFHNIVNNLNRYRSLYKPLIKELTRIHTASLPVDKAHKSRLEFKRFMGKRRPRITESLTPYTYAKIYSGGLPGLGKRK